jgi:hypothetical protein
MVSRYSKWMALLAFITLMVACFLPWTYHADLGKAFTGFFSEKNSYGKPAKFLLLLGGLTTIISFIPILWLKRASLFFAGVNLAYAIKTFLMYGSCYRGYCPEKQYGLYLMLLSVGILMLTTMFPEGKSYFGNTSQDKTVRDEKSGNA